MVTVLVVKTGLCVASGIVAASVLAAGGALVPAVASLWRGEPAGEFVGATAAARAATASIRSEIQIVFFISNSGITPGKMRFRPWKGKLCVGGMANWECWPFIRFFSV